MKINISYNKQSKDSVKVSVKNDDLWNADITLARVIYPVLKKYRKLYNKGWLGCPMDFAQDPTKPEGPENRDRLEDWIACLDAMVYSFEWIAKHNDWDGPSYVKYSKESDRLLALHIKELKKLRKEDNKCFGKIKNSDNLESLELNRQLEIIQPAFHKYHKDFELHHKKIQNGLDLFAKYFGALWI